MRAVSCNRILRQSTTKHASHVSLLKRYAASQSDSPTDTSAPSSGPNDDLSGRTLHDLQKELEQVQKRAEQLANAIKYFKDTKRKRILLLGAG